MSRSLYLRAGPGRARHARQYTACDARSDAGVFDTPLSTSGSYFQRSQLPLVCLTFLLPLLLVYEVGTTYVAGGRIHAFNLLQEFFQFCHASGRYLPALAVAAILLCWHMARNDAWKIDLQTPWGMLLESVLLSLPLLALAGRYGFNALDGASLRLHIVASIGAGLYEELVFRLIGFTLLSLLLMDVLKFRETWAVLSIVCFTAVLFAGYHYLGKERFDCASFLFRTIGGIYFGVLFLWRGFGITAGSHASYDILMALLSVWAHHH